MSEEKKRTDEELQNQNRILQMAAQKWDQLHDMLLQSQVVLQEKYDSLRETGERMERALKAGDLAWWDWDVRTGDMFYNEERARMLGYTMDELPETMEAVLTCIHPEDKEMVVARLHAHEKGETLYYEAEYRLQSKEGKWKWFHDRGKVMHRDIMGQPTVISGVLIDITDRKETETAMIQARDMANAANRAKSLFLSNMSHEIYTPLAGVVGMADILMQSDLQDEQREYIEIVVQSANNLMSVLNDIMEFIHVENNQVVLANTPVYLTQMLQEITIKTLEKCETKGLELLTFFDTRIPDVVMGDPHRIRQLVQIFINNAVKFTDEGRITVSVEFDSWDEDSIRVRFRIGDTGIGIPAQEVSRLFQSFTRLNTKIGKYGGSGLGLSIAEHLVKMMNGRISVESEEGKGSVFSCTIELERLMEQERYHDPGAVKGKRILIIGKNSPYRSVLRDYLLIWECEVEESDSQSKALEFVKHQREAGSPFDAIILIHHPGIRLQRGFQNTILSVYQTGTVPSADIREAGIGIVLYRPFIPGQLLDAIEQAMGGNGKEIVYIGKIAGDEQDATEKRVLKILLAEDNLINQKVALVTLSKLGHQTDLAQNGKEAVEKVRDTVYDLVLMDVFMPELDGLGATREIRQLEAAEQRNPVFICAITANMQQEDEEACLAAGMDAYITKPFKLKELKKVFGKL